MSLWRAAPVDQEPEITLCDWMIVEAEFVGEESSLHFVGARSIDGGSGRVSSPIVEFDFKTMQGKTRSGRVYKLVGEPGTSDNGLYVWRQWCSINRVDKWTDVSQDVMAEHKKTVEENDAST